MASDARLVRASRDGDQEAFGRIVRRYQSLVCAVTYSGTGDLAASEDLAQETFITAWRGLDSLRDPSRLRGWLCSIARNLALQWRRQRQGDVTTGAVSVEQAGSLESATPSPVERALSKERESVVWGALNEMPEDYRIPLILYYREQQSVGRVAEALDLSRSAVKMRLTRGRSMLKDRMIALVEDTLKTTRPGDTFAVGVMAALGAAAGKKAAGVGSTILGLSLAKAAVIGTVAVGAAVGGGLAVQRLAAPSQAPAPPPAVADETPKPEAAQPRTFNSQVAFNVYTVKETGDDGQMVGATPSERPLTIPPCQWWFVVPLPPVDMEKVREEARARQIPGFTLHSGTDADLEYLEGLTGLQWLDLQDAMVTDAGLAHLEGLNGLQALNLMHTAITDAGLVHLKGLTGLRQLILRETAVTGAGLEHLEGLKGLRFLSLGDTNVSDAGLAHLKGLTELRHLILWHAKVTDAGLEHLKGLTALQGLWLGGTQITEAGLEQLKGLTGLKRLDLSKTKVTDAGLLDLEGMTGLEALYLWKAQVTDAGLEHLKGLTALEWLDLEGTEVTDAGLEQLKGLTALEWLDLEGTEVTDSGLVHLKGLTNLQVLDLKRTRVTDAGVEQLKMSLHNVRVARKRPALRPVAEAVPPQAAFPQPPGGLHAAAYAGKKWEVERLLAGGADVNGRGPGGRTPLHYAAEQGRLEIVQLLVAKGANVNAEDGGQCTPLHLAAQGGHREVVAALLKAGAEVNAVDAEGWTPTGRATQAGHKELARFLAEHGGVE